MPKVSVIIPVYNAESYLEKCLDSVLAQKLEDFEVICIDDGSTDGSTSILNSYAQKDKRIHSIFQENAGPGAARNAGISKAVGEYAAFLDADDWVEPEYLKEAVRQAGECEADILICHAEEIDSDTEKRLPSGYSLKVNHLPNRVISPEQIRGELFQCTGGQVWDKLYRMEFLISKRIRYPELKHSEDIVFTYQSLALANRIAEMDGAYIHHRVNREGSVSNSMHLRMEEIYVAIDRLRTELKEWNVYDIYEQSFLNMSLEFLIWSTARIRGREAQRQCFRMLKKDWLPQLGIHLHPAAYYNSRSVYIKYLIVRYGSYRLFFAVLKIYRLMRTVKTAGYDYKVGGELYGLYYCSGRRQRHQDERINPK